MSTGVLKALGSIPPVFLQLFELMALASMPCLAWADDGPWSASIGATTDYVYRGISQTYDHAAVQLGANYQSAAGWFAGAWGSNVDPYPRAQSALELDLYTGFRQPLSDNFNAAVTYTHYLYLDDPRPDRYDYDQFELSASYMDRLVASVSYQPDLTQYSRLGYAERRASICYELAGRWQLPAGFALEAGGGYYDLHSLFGVSYWAGNAGLHYVYRRLSLDLSRFFADSTATRLYDGASANGTWVLSALLRF
ncbi:MAG: TorF family putative porin [Steroidobacteraceae bacterium]|jgi:uncharacterized protein (TIGR02001 family)